MKNKNEFVYYHLEEHLPAAFKRIATLDSLKAAKSVRAAIIKAEPYRYTIIIIKETTSSETVFVPKVKKIELPDEEFSIMD